MADSKHGSQCVRKVDIGVPNSWRFLSKGVRDKDTVGITGALQASRCTPSNECGSRHIVGWTGKAVEQNDRVPELTVTAQWKPGGGRERAAGRVSALGLATSCWVAGYWLPTCSIMNGKFCLCSSGGGWRKRG